ncbi:hypothetical protein H9Q13_15655 [Pontibacter sp. JH31]|uniref:Uncharacterized protein n=1 Tax=Pontibacter aquaedesilientis TaxID=2766980 RepID=A0ABR7XLS1_9BACT|nr:hypothetical protein [Pontibacter aquaedesilientis]MBD1398608.1 hypothetical protein [Pontibacter aquaedesilientis]
MKKRLLSICPYALVAALLLIGTGVSYAQVIYPIGGDKYSSATSKLFDEAYNAAKDSADVPVLLTKIRKGSNVDTSPLAQAFPKYRIPSLLLPVALPNLSAYIDTVAVLWYLRNPLRPSVGVVNVMMIAQKPDGGLVYFVDSNNNGNFMDDGKPFEFKPDEKQRQVEIRDNRVGEVSLLLQNLAPTPIVETLESEKKSTRSWSVNETDVNKKFGVHFIGGLSSGSGNATMFYRVKDKPDSDERNKSYTYSAKYFASLQTSLGLALSYRNLYIGGSGSYELSQVGEQNLTTRYEKAGKPAQQFLNNQGSWPYTRVNLTVFAEYDIPLNRTLKFAPKVSYTRYNLLTEHPFKVFGEAKLNDYFLDRYSYSYGGKVKYKASGRTMLFVELYRRVNHFDASSYFPDIVEGSFHMDLEQVYGGIGVQVKMFDF